MAGKGYSRWGKYSTCGLQWQPTAMVENERRMSHHTAAHRTRNSLRGHNGTQQCSRQALACLNA